jgi:hypothetical protein
LEARPAPFDAVAPVVIIAVYCVFEARLLVGVKVAVLVDDE